MRIAAIATMNPDAAMIAPAMTGSIATAIPKPPQAAPMSHQTIVDRPRVPSRAASRS